MFETTSVNKFDGNNFLVKDLRTSKENYGKSRDYNYGPQKLVVRAALWEALA